MRNKVCSVASTNNNLNSPILIEVSYSDLKRRCKVRFTRSNFCIQLFIGPLFKTTARCVNAYFWQVPTFFGVLYDNRTSSIFIQLDQKSSQYFIFPRSVLQNTFTKWPPPRFVRAHYKVIERENWTCVNAAIFHGTQQKFSIIIGTKLNRLNRY